MLLFWRVNHLISGVSSAFCTELDAAAESVPESHLDSESHIHWVHYEKSPVPSNAVLCSSAASFAVKCVFVINGPLWQNPPVRERRRPRRASVWIWRFVPPLPFACDPSPRAAQKTCVCCARLRARVGLGSCYSHELLVNIQTKHALRNI